MKKEYLVWCDALRLVAFLLLFACHAADPFYASAAYATADSNIDPDLLQWAMIWGSLVRPCVPLFVMLTGVLSLPVKSSMESFCKKRISRVFFPFVLWSVIYYLTPWFTGLMGFDSSAVHHLFCWAESDCQSLADGLSLVAKIPYSFSYIASHMWYIYMLIGLYLYLPVFSAWVERATKRQKEIFLVMWACSTMLPYFNEYVSQYAFGTCTWNSFGLFYYFAGFSGYLLLGHYMQHYVKWGWIRTLVVAVPLLVAGFAITYAGYSHIMALAERTPEQIELFWTYNTPNVAMMTVAFFLLALKVYILPNSTTARMLANLTKCGFGIYMVHYYFVCLGFDLGEWLRIPAPLRIPFSALVILICSWSVIALLKRIMGRRSVYFIG